MSATRRKAASAVWRPSATERKCLQHLDSPGGWKMLRVTRPEESDVLSWRPFRRIFGFNLVLFLVIMTIVFVGLEITTGADREGIREDLPYGIAGVVLIATALAAYSARLYRRSWNRRAHSIRYQLGMAD